MFAIAKAFLGKYLFEIIAGICFAVAIGIVWYNVSHWCNAACKEVKRELTAAQKQLAVCQGDLKAVREFHEAEVRKWNAEVERQKAEIEAAKKAKAEVVTTHRKKFDTIFKRNSKNEQESNQRMVAQIRPTDVVVAPLALVREYNEAVARAPAAQGDSRSEIGLPGNPTGIEGQIGTFDALAVAKALVDNVNAYNQLAIRCDSLVDIVTDLEKKYGANPGRSDGEVGISGGNVSDGTSGATIQ